MRTSVVISTYTKERVDDIERCLRCLEAQSVAPFEILVVLDPDPELVAFYEPRVAGRARLLVSPQHGLSAARNLGIRESRGDIIAFIDDDAFPETPWLATITDAFLDPDVMVVGGRILASWPKGRPWWWPAELDWAVGCTYDGHPTTRTEVRNVIGANMAIRREVVKHMPECFATDMGRFGKHLLGSEEMEFCVRLRERLPGAKVIHEPEAVVRHRVTKKRASFRYLARRAFGEGLSKRRVRSRHASPTTLSCETAYLRHLARAVARRLLRPTPASLLQITAILIAIGATASGYAMPLGGTTARPSRKPTVSS